jgi:phage FluMu gp28-like protein
VEGILFSAANKLDMATVLKESMQDRKSRIPAGDVPLRADLHSIKKQVGVTGTPRLIADSDTDGHADRFWAGALAVSAGQLTYQPYDYRPVPLGGGSDFDRDIRSTGGFRVGKGIF